MVSSRERMLISAEGTLPCISCTFLYLGSIVAQHVAAQPFFDRLAGVYRFPMRKFQIPVALEGPNSVHGKGNGNSSNMKKVASSRKRREAVAWRQCVRNAFMEVTVEFISAHKRLGNYTPVSRNGHSFRFIGVCKRTFRGGGDFPCMGGRVVGSLRRIFCVEKGLVEGPNSRSTELMADIFLNDSLRIKKIKDLAGFLASGDILGQVVSPLLQGIGQFFRRIVFKHFH